MTDNEVRKGRLRTEFSDEERERLLGLLRSLVIAQSASVPLLLAAGLVEAQGKRGIDVLLVVAGCLFALILAPIGLLVARRGYLFAGSFLFVASSLVSIALFVAFYGTQSTVPFLYVWPVMVAGILLEPVASVVVAGISAIFMIVLFVMEQLQMGVPLMQPGPLRPYTNVAGTIIFLLIVSYLAWLSARSLIKALAGSRERARQLAAAKAEVERKSMELEAQQTGLEEEVARRTHDLEAAIEGQRRLIEVIAEMSTPVVPVFEGVIVLPLVGVIDAQRAQRIVRGLLTGLTQYRARVAILDITGVPMVDSMVAGYIMEAAEGVRLLGGEAVLVGITPLVAQSIVGLGVDLSGVVTRSDLQAGIVYALGRVGMGLTAKESHRPGPIS